MTTKLPILYSFRRCPYAMRTRMALLVSGQKCIVREVLLRDKPGDMVSVSPKATVPVLQLPDGQIIDESLAIMRWSLAKNDPEGWLEAGREAGRDADTMIAANDGPFKHHLDRYKYSVRYDSDPVEHRNSAMQILADLDLRLGMQGNLCGQKRSFADIALFPFIRQFAATDKLWFDAQPVAHLQAWLAQHMQSRLFTIAMVRLAQWQPGDPDIGLPDYRGETDA